MEKIQKVNILTATYIIAFAVIARLGMSSVIGLPMNFSPIDAIALFSGAYLSKKYMAFIVPLFAIWFSDILINRVYFDHWSLFYQGFYWQYASYMLITLVGIFLAKRLTPLNLVAASLSSSLLFFGISNFGVWMNGLMYPMTLDGLVACYVAGIPFFKNTIVSDLIFSGVVFGVFQGLDYLKLVSSLNQKANI
jgi:hypothetical protein